VNLAAAHQILRMGVRVLQQAGHTSASENRKLHRRGVIGFQLGTFFIALRFKGSLPRFD
jgi:hypothetical protein